MNMQLNKFKYLLDYDNHCHLAFGTYKNPYLSYYASESSTF